MKSGRFPGGVVGLLAIYLAGCAGPSLMVVGETVRPPDPLLTVRVVDQAGDPVPGAEVMIGSRRVASDQAGRAASKWQGGPIVIAAAAPTFQPISTQLEQLPADSTVELQLQPLLLRGVVVGDHGRPLPESVVRLGEVRAWADRQGAFRLEGVEPGQVRVRHPAWMPSTFSWNGDQAPVEVQLRPRIVKGLYAGFGALASQDAWSRLMDLAQGTEINAVVVDLKDSSGGVIYDSAVDRAGQSGATDTTHDVSRLLADLQQRELYAIARLVAFEDPVAATAFPKLAVWDIERNAPWRSDAGREWLDPTDPEAQAYLLDLAVEACQLGFAEVQFDYVRFPTDRSVERARFDGGNTEEVRMAAISGFLAEARTRLHERGCALAADIFGFMTASSDDGRIGQRIDAMSRSVDVISPMVYPSHYSSGWYGYDLPNDHPAGVVSKAIDDGLARMRGAALMRPWLQAFSLGAGIAYGPTEVRAQIEVAEGRELGWMLWNPASRFDELALREE